MAVKGVKERWTEKESVKEKRLANIQTWQTEKDRGKEKDIIDFKEESTVRES